MDQSKIETPYNFNVDQDKIESVFNFSKTSTSPLVWDNQDTKPGTYWFYLIRLNEPGRATGNVSRVSGDGSAHKIWAQAGQKTSGNIEGTKQAGAQAVFELSNGGGKSITKSAGFEAKDGQNLILTAQSTIKGGSVDFFLFSPSGQEQRITIGGSSTIQTISLSAGTWAYNCTGFFDSGDITIVGKLS